MMKKLHFWRSISRRHSPSAFPRASVAWLYPSCAIGERDGPMPDASTVSVIQALGLTQADLIALERLTQGMITAQLWTSARRSREPHCDCFEIATDAISGAALSI